MAWPDTSLILEATLELDADLTADPSAYAFATDITSYVFDRGGDSSVVIQRGRTDEMSQSQPSTIDLTLDNTDGRFTSRNPVGAYYPNLRRNTPIRIRVNPGSGLNTRAVGYLSELPSRWDVAEVDFHVPIHADGVLRRIGQGHPASNALLKPAILADDPMAYWPMEDGASATTLASALSDVEPMIITGDIDLATSSAILGSLPLPVFNSGSQAVGYTGVTVAGKRGPVFIGDDWSLEFSAILADGFYTPLFWTTIPGGGAGPTYWQFSVLSSTDVRVFVTDSSGAQQTPLSWNPTTTGVFADPHNWVITATQSGTSINCQAIMDGTTVDTGSVTTQTIGRISSVAVSYNVATDPFTVGHIALYAAVTGGHYSEFSGLAGEISGTRFARICTDADIVSDVTAGSTEAMGAQTTNAPLDLLRECEAAEEGLMVERRTGELGFDPHSVRENQAVGLTLNYTTGQVSPPLEPTDDDQQIRNDITVTRTGGSSARAIDFDGPAGTIAVGRYEDAVTVNLYTDDQVGPHAGWRLNLGTVDEQRFPTVTVNLRRQSSLVASWLALDIGSRIQITNVPDRISYDTIDLIVEGYTEQISQKNWVITFNCAPYKPYGVFEISDDSADSSEFVGRLAGDDECAIRVAIDSDDTSIDFDPNFYRWTSAADDFDPDLRVRFGGETADVSTIATTAGTFVAVGAASHADNAAVTPALYAGATTRDLICVLAAIRSSGTGTLTTPSNYTLLPVWSSSENVALFAKVHTGSESDPTVTPVGGAAGDTVSAFTFGLRGTPTTLADLTDIAIDPLKVLNASAQDITYPGIYPWNNQGCIILLLAWKQDDYTSIAVPTGLTEILEASTITGNDQSLYAAYQIQTTPAVVNGGSLVVTGGASAISRAAIVAIAAGYQTMTISARSVNGVVKSHAAGTLIEVDKPYVLGL